MAKKILHVNIADKIATYQKRDGVIVCGNDDYQIKFTFDDEWAEHDKKFARFLWLGDYYDQEIEGDTCDVPVIKGADAVEIGVYAGDLETTTGAEIPCLRSILCKGGAPHPETGQHYSNEAVAAAESAKASETSAKASEISSAESATTATEQAEIATEQATSASASSASATESATQAKGYMEYAQELASDYENIDARISRNSKRISNLEKGIVPSPFVTDSTVARVKAVPANSSSCALLQKVGGMSYAGDFSGLRSAAVTNVIATGKNIWNEQWEIGGINSSGQNLTGDKYQDRIRSKGYTAVLPNTKYRYSSPNGSANGVAFYDASYNFISKEYLSPVEVFTTPALCAYIRFDFSVAYGNTYKNDTIISLGTTAVDYEPYKELTNFPIPAEVQSLEGYGLGVNADYNNHISWDDDGKAKWNVMVRRKVFEGTETFSVGNNKVGTLEGAFKLTGADTGVSNSSIVACVTNHYEAVSRDYIYLNSGNFVAVSYDYIRIQDTSVSTITSLKAKLAAWYAEGNPLIVDYILATPVVTDISDLITPDNIIEVAGGGSLLFENSHNLAPASTVTYQTKEGAV